MYLIPVCRQPCAQLYLISNGNIMNWNLNFGFVPERDKPIHVLNDVVDTVFVEIMLNV